VKLIFGQMEKTPAAFGNELLRAGLARFLGALFQAGQVVTSFEESCRWIFSLMDWSSGDRKEEGLVEYLACETLDTLLAICSAAERSTFHDQMISYLTSLLGEPGSWTKWTVWGRILACAAHPPRTLLTCPSPMDSIPRLLSSVVSTVSSPATYFVRQAALKALLRLTTADSLPDAAWTTDGLLPAVRLGLADSSVTEDGDVGSFVRAEAVRITFRLLNLGFLRDGGTNDLLAGILRIAVEKMDRLRVFIGECAQEGRIQDGVAHSGQDPGWQLLGEIRDWRQHEAVYRSIVSHFLGQPAYRSAILYGLAASIGSSSDSHVSQLPGGMRVCGPLMRSWLILMPFGRSWMISSVSSPTIDRRD
jgi:hypothetical protein